MQDGVLFLKYKLQYLEYRKIKEQIKNNFYQQLSKDD